MKALVRKNTACLVCGNRRLIPYLNLGQSAFANSYVRPQDAKKKAMKAPLIVCYCPVCHLSQLAHIVDRGALFNSYAYFSSTSPQLLVHFRGYAKEIMRRFPKQTKRLTVEIASNDGILLKPLKEMGAKVLGIDPARNIARKANKEGVPTIPQFFSSSVACRIKKKYGSAGVVIANNVLAHTDILQDIIKGVSLLLADDGVFVFETQYVKDLLQHNEFDNTYHEHTCYFSLHPLAVVLEKYDLVAFDIEHVDTQGGSLRVFAAKKDSGRRISPRIPAMLRDEVRAGLTKEVTYNKFAERPPRVAKALHALLTKLCKEGKIIAGYGAPAKGNTLLQYAHIDNRLISYITDEAPSKQGLLTPGSKIPILAPSKHLEAKPDYIVILAWNYAASILKREAALHKAGVRFIVPIPFPRIV
jgi:C-methyltransferase C-terminal domain/Putative zinc binding domain/Methyltransferase domain